MKVRELIKMLQDGGPERMDWDVALSNGGDGLYNVSYVGETNGAPKLVMINHSNESWAGPQPPIDFAEPEARPPLNIGRHTFFTQDFNGATCSKCAKPFSDGNHLPIYDSDRCGCDGCWACEGHVLGCTCDVDWDEVYGNE